MNQSEFHCQVCQDEGKPLGVYKSHNVRTPRDKYGKYKILCPTLLERGCRYCYTKGHVGRFCPVITSEKFVMEKMVARPETNQMGALV